MNSIDRINQLNNKANAILATEETDDFFGFTTVDKGSFYAWKTQAINFLESILPEGNVYLSNFSTYVSDNIPDHVKTGIGILNNIKEDIQQGNLFSKSNTAIHKPLDYIERICDRFHLVVMQLRDRYDSRETLDVSDEYDVQDLMHSLLLMYFDDIRPEEWTPSYAGKSSRMDFLLKQEKIVIEIKKTRKGLNAKELGSQLIEDIARYQSHQDCKTLVCFVYDPDGYITNPRGIENDLNRKEGGLTVKVMIAPRYSRDNS